MLFAAALGRHATGRRGRRFGIVLLVALAGLSGGIRVRSYLLTRKIQAVLVGLQQLKVDTTKEEELLRTVPYLVREPFERREGLHLTRYYRSALSNEDDYYRFPRWVPGWVLDLSPPEAKLGSLKDIKWNAMGVSLKAAYILGWRYLSFFADVTVLDGRVSKISYGIEPDVFMGWPKGYLVTAQSTHGFWRARHLPAPVSSPEDEGYQSGFIVSESGSDAIGVAYRPDAPREKVSHVYQIDLSCFWNVRGCNSARQIVPLLWKDRQEY